MRKPLNIGLVGYGFMGRTHSNGYKRVNDFFDLPYRPVLKAVCGRTESGTRAFAEKWGYESIETDWRKLIARDGHRRRRHLHAEQLARRDRHRRRRGRQDDPLREAALDGPRRGAADGRRHREGRRPQHRLVQLPPGPRRHPGPSVDPGGPARPDLPLPGQLPPGLDHQRRRPAGRRGALAARRGGGRLGRDRRPPGPLHRHGPLAQRGDHERHGDDRDLRQGAEAQPHRPGRAGEDRRRLRLPLPVRERVPRPLRVDPLRPGAQGPLHLRDQRRERLGQVGPPRPPPAPVLRLQGRLASPGAGGRSTSPTATTLT